MRFSTRFFYVALFIGLFCFCNRESEKQKPSKYKVPELPVQKGKKIFPEGLIGSIPKNQNKTNVIIIFADDLGYGDLQIYGGKDMMTPEMNRMGQEGLFLKNVYSPAPVCSPSRVGLITGIFPCRFPYPRHFWDRDEDFLPAENLTYAEVFRDNGYLTSHVGKWHLGGNAATNMRKRLNSEETIPGIYEHGFQHYLSSFEQKDPRWAMVQDKTLYSQGWKFIVRNDSLVNCKEKHFSDIKTDEALRVIKECSKNQVPFFINLWYDLPHKPYEAVMGEKFDQYQEMGYRGEELIAKSMISKLDDNIGRLISYLDSSGLTKNTIVIVTSDNGPPNAGSSGGFKGGKGSLYEGGLRMPFLVYGKPQLIQRIKSSVSDLPNRYNLVDVFPTLIDLCNLHVNQDISFDGVSLLNDSFDFSQREMPFIRFENQAYLGPGKKPEIRPLNSFVSGNYKLHVAADNKILLYNLEIDPFEEKNISEADSLLVDSLISRFNTYLVSPEL